MQRHDSLLLKARKVHAGYEPLEMKMVKDWIPFEDGRYSVPEAFLVAAGNTAVELHNPYIEIFTGRTGKRWLKGGSLVQNFLMVELMEESDELDILLNAGEDFGFLMQSPEIQAGKVFSPSVRSSLKFMPTEPWQPLTPAEFRQLKSTMKLISPETL
ncbi:MAG: hypothetical protein NWR42_04150 [Desulfobacterales bacterium]|nr:hypothetical protein [Desulfobacterales bacterium]